MEKYESLEEHATAKVGDTVWCKPTHERRFQAKVLEIRKDPDDQITAEVVGGPSGRSAFRSFRIEQVTPIVVKRKRRSRDG